jgi:hypothetical protein
VVLGGLEHPTTLLPGSRNCVRRPVTFFSPAASEAILDLWPRRAYRSQTSVHPGCGVWTSATDSAPADGRVELHSCYPRVVQGAQIRALMAAQGRGDMDPAAEGMRDCTEPAKRVESLPEAFRLLDFVTCGAIGSALVRHLKNSL